MPYVEKLTAANSVATSVGGTPPNGAPVCGPDGQPEGTFNGEPENDELGGDGGMSGGVGGGGGSGGGGTGGDGAGAGDESGDDGGDEDGGEGDDCFAAGTPILMADGTLKDIAQISVGDHVRWTDPVTGVSGITHVLSVHASVARPTLQLTLEDGAVLLTTARQPFLHLSTQSFVKAAAFSSHDELHSLDANGKVIPAKISSVERSAVPRTVYSLHTSPVDHFIVGVARIPVKKKE
jgi:hypothetical protein